MLDKLSIIDTIVGGAAAAQPETQQWNNYQRITFYLLITTTLNTLYIFFKLNSIAIQGF